MPFGFKTCAPNECMVVSGLCHSKPKLVLGGKSFLWPFIQKLQRIKLNVLTCVVTTANVYTQKGVPVSITATAQVCHTSILIIFEF